MDTVTQTILGAAVGEAFRHKLGGKAVVVGAACGLLPDLDMVSKVAGDWAMLIHHRGISHSLFTLAVATPLLGWLAWRWTRSENRSQYATWCQLVFWALITHPLLDVCTSYGTQLLAPFSDKRLSIDAVSIIDLVYTLPLLLAVLLGLCKRLSPLWRQCFALSMLTLTTLYLGAGYLQSRRAIAIAGEQLAAQGFKAAEVRAVPTLLNICLWRIVARDEQGNIRVGALSTVAPGAISFHELSLPQDPLWQKAWDSERGKVFRWFAMDMVSGHIERHTQGAYVYLEDQRYGLVTDPTRSIFRARAAFDKDGNLLAVDLLRRERDFAIGKELSALWQGIWGK